MTFIDWDQEVDTLASDGSHQSFAERIRGGRSYWRFQDTHTEVFQRRVDIG